MGGRGWVGGCVGESGLEGGRKRRAWATRERERERVVEGG